eukprot:TRINITY_DN16413_c0_g1_i1.p2 TRINITY_DN16413_c0_g1~~TRINITY_DN16413_c0_g1_i1.p2  ORF type:complete len:104 (+),score=18.81 TRINITY_DN16413_c0_g1_i1:267-578(+)
MFTSGIKQAENGSPSKTEVLWGSIPNSSRIEERGKVSAGPFPANVEINQAPQSQDLKVKQLPSISCEDLKELRFGTKSIKEIVKKCSLGEIASDIGITEKDVS